MTPWLLLIVLGGVAEKPDPATLVYYNARMALSERRPTEALKLWLLRNALESRTGALSPHDEDFLSVTWVALGELGLCQDGLRFDSSGAGLWPLALHNWFVRNRRRKQLPARPSPFDAFELGQQQRLISVRDVLSVQELQTVRFFRTTCFRMSDVLVDAGGSMSDDPADAEIALGVLRNLLEKALRTLKKDRVRGAAMIQARLFDVRLRQIEQLEKSLLRAERQLRRRGKVLQLNLGPSVEVARTEEMSALLSVTSGWTVDDWLALDSARRLFLYDQVRPATEPDAQRQLQLSVIDRLIAQGAGKELGMWIAYAGDEEPAKAQIWSGARGKALLGLERSTGFRERSAIALHRGVDYLGSGALADALRSFAYGLHYASESTYAEQTRRLSLRWLSYVASRFEVTDELVAMLVALVPRADLAHVLEDLLWTAALSADAPSFDRIIRAHRGRGALVRRAARLRPLADGDVGRFLTALRAELTEAPHTSLRFLRRFLQRLQTQDGDVRINHRATLLAMRALLSAKLLEAERRGGVAEKIAKLDDAAASMLDGMPGEAATDSARDRARGLSPSAEVFAGRIRLAPSDPLPWPFPLPTGLRAPSVFTPLAVTPVQWRSEAGVVMGWKLGK